MIELIDKDVCIYTYIYTTEEWWLMKMVKWNLGFKEHSWQIQRIYAYTNKQRSCLSHADSRTKNNVSSSSFFFSNRLQGISLFWIRKHLDLCIFSLSGFCFAFYFMLSVLILSRWLPSLFLDSRTKPRPSFSFVSSCFLHGAFYLHVHNEFTLISFE